MLRNATAFLLLAASAAQAELVATFTRDVATDSRLDRFPALAIEAGEPATPFLTPGPFQAVWKGKIVVPKRMRLVFSFEGEGKAALKIAGKDVLTKEGDLGGKGSESTRLNPGEHEMEISYSSKPDGTATFRIFWEEASFPRQTIPASAFKAEATEATTLGELQRHGREVFAAQNCFKCHSGPTTMPETQLIPPILGGIGDRTSEEWLRRWIADPKTLKPTTHMPSLVDASTEEGRQQASDLAAHLVKLKTASSGPAPDAKLAEEGGAHFHELGCVACHNAPDKGVTDPSRVPLNNVASKYLPGALVAFLKSPDTYHPAIKMPNFNLSDAEANSIAAFLTEASKGKETKFDKEFPKGDADRGAKLAESLQCGTCHAGEPMDPTKFPIPLDGLFKKDWAAGGCAAPADKLGKSPHLNLSDKDRAALVAFSKTGADSLNRDTAAEYTTRQIETLRCTACHAIDSKQPLLNGFHGETAGLAAHIKSLHERVDQTRPQLTFTGEMLYTSAIESMIAGTTEPRPRPWLAMRMPAFKNQATGLANGFSKLHGHAPDKPAEVKVDPALAAIGKDLVSATGFGCTTCHGIGDMKPTAAFEVEGVNFKLFPNRIREDYYHRWMDNPQAVIPGTKMPRYSQDNKSQRTDVLDGDAKKQFEAIWNYLHQK
ncbi:c-type cytochrome [Luteolibacter yonseiensis]|uniref:C-type cytochrome n=1 Tax=Luteolibacter yonseiensis TaxID=1144680 RepID=A0A934R5D8_9BACT|nr:c-type cytochrome [Luteolibacter yonseiensis]MBK1817287.1 c-type cytochrome [Luteolibacter yonseiensis]